MRQCEDCGVRENPIFLSISHLTTCKSWGSLEGLSIHSPEGWEAFQCQYCKSETYEPLSGRLAHYPICRYYQALDTAPLKSVRAEEGNDFLKGLTTMSVDGLIIRACKIASEAHRGQTRRYTGDPYVLHPMRVAGRVMLLISATPVEIAAAWLHDVLEDSKLTEKDLEDRGMPNSVIKLVMALTNPSKSMPEETPRATRKAVDFEHLAKQSPWVKKIKMIDRIDNLTEMSWHDKDFMAIYCQESRGLAEAIGDADEDLKKELISLIDYYENELTTMQKEI